MAGFVGPIRFAPLFVVLFPQWRDSHRKALPLPFPSPLLSWMAKAGEDRNEQFTDDPVSVGAAEEGEQEFSLVARFVADRHPLFKKLIFCIALYNLAVVPFRACVDVPSDLAAVVIDLFLDGLMWVEFIANLLLPEGNNDPGAIHPKNMLHNIRKRESVLELCALLPLDFIGLVLAASKPYYLHPAFRLNKLLRVMKLGWYFGELRQIAQVSHNGQRVFEFVVLILWLTHWLGCVWVLIVRLEGEKPTVWYWTQNPGLTEEGAFFKYILGVYWALTMMTGYGSIIPQTDYQVIYSLFTVLVGVAGNVGVLGTLGSLVQNLDSSGALFRQKMDALSDYMRYRKISLDMQRRIMEYYNYLWGSRRGIDEATLIMELPHYLREEVSLYINREIISKVPLFNECDEQFKTAVVIKLIPTVLLPGSFIVRKGEVGREMYFINRGEVQVISDHRDPSERIVYATLRDGSFFGEVALLFNDSRRTATVIASQFCDLFVLRKEDFDLIKESFPDQSRAIQRAAQKRYKLQQENEEATK
eukprot:Sspe_Gene.90626::Locus_62151_Transcript_1_1_Confidence_1.000_Length_2060::g.90626::m.90626/K04950/CNGA3; cyclic nucleotide gated channel alpha 3